MKPVPNFHPLQSYRHLTNLMAGNDQVRDREIRRLNELEKHKEEIEKIIAELKTETLPSINEARKIIISQFKDLLPDLRGFQRTHDATEDIITKG